MQSLLRRLPVFRRRSGMSVLPSLRRFSSRIMCLGISNFWSRRLLGGSVVCGHAQPRCKVGCTSDRLNGPPPDFCFEVTNGDLNEDDKRAMAWGAIGRQGDCRLAQLTGKDSLCPSPPDSGSGLGAGANGKLSGGVVVKVIRRPPHLGRLTGPNP